MSMQSFDVDACSDFMDQYLSCFPSYFIMLVGIDSNKMFMTIIKMNEMGDE